MDDDEREALTILSREQKTAAWTMAVVVMLLFGALLNLDRVGDVEPPGQAEPLRPVLARLGEPYETMRGVDVAPAPTTTISQVPPPEPRPTGFELIAFLLEVLRLLPMFLALPMFLIAHRDR